MESILAKALGQEGAAAVAEKRVLLERLMARLAHEIRNPLSSLNIHVQLLEEDLAALAPSPAARDQMSGRLEIIHGELHRLESIVEQFLRLSGPSALDLEEVDVGRVVAHVCELLGPEAASREIELRPVIESEMERPSESEPGTEPERRTEAGAGAGPGPGPAVPRTLADPVRLTQALMNMVINAMQAVERKGRIDIKTAARDGKIVVAVHDNGPGIPAERMGSIFDPYFTTKPEGSGLGLWIAQQIVTAHGGTLSAQNGPEGGAVFTMVVPVRKPAEPE